MHAIFVALPCRIPYFLETETIMSNFSVILPVMQLHGAIVRTMQSLLV